MTEEDVKKIREMMEFLVKERVSKKLKELSSDEKKVYELASKSESEMIKITGFSAGKISKIRQKLESEGLLVRESLRYRKVV